MKNKMIIIVIAAIFVAGIVGSALVLTAPAKGTVRIVSDGEVVDTIDLSTAEDAVFDIAYQGHVNTAEIKDGRIHMLSADCPDQTCVKMGWLSSGAMPIVCLPHHLVIEYVDGADEMDAITR